MFSLRLKFVIGPVDVTVLIKRKLATRVEFIEADYQNKQNLVKEFFEGNTVEQNNKGI